MQWKYRYAEATRPNIYETITHDDCEFFRKMEWQNTTNIDEHIMSVHNPLCRFEDGLDADFKQLDGSYVSHHFDFIFAGAGDTRKTKALFATKEVRNKILPYIMNGLTMDDINTPDSKGKYPCSGLRFTTYESLWFTGSRRFKDFDIDRVIVIKDLENTIEYDAIKVDATKEYVSAKMEPTSADVEITDGAGMFLPEVYKDPDNGEYLRAFTARAPWFKGLMVEHDFMEVAKRTGNYILKDAWGQDHNIYLEGINTIWTTSQLKLWKAYKSWDHYKRAFKDLDQYFCVALTPEKKNFIILSYQMLQDLRATEQEVHRLLKPHFKKLWIAHGKVTGRSEENKVDGFNYVGTKKAIGLYKLRIFREVDAMLNTNWVRKKVREYLRNEIKKIKYGKIRVKGKEPFVSPDWNWVCNQLFNDNMPIVPADKKVCCRDLKEGTEFDIIRYPHLYTGSHCVRSNIYIDGLYAPVVYACANSIDCKLLEFDCDGDHLQLLTDENLLAIVKNGLNELPPIHYECSGGKKYPIYFDFSEHGIYTELKTSYGDESNIGIPSNWATKIYNDCGYDWNTKYKLVSMLAHMIQGCIDFAKAGVSYRVPDELAKELDNLVKPSFMRYAKYNEDTDRLEALNYKEMLAITKRMWGDIMPYQLSDERYHMMLIQYRKERTRYEDFVHYKEAPTRDTINKNPEHQYVMDWIQILAEEELKEMKVDNWHAETSRFTSDLREEIIDDYNESDTDEYDNEIIFRATEYYDPKKLPQEICRMDEDEFEKIEKFRKDCNNKFTIPDRNKRINDTTMMDPDPEVADQKRKEFYELFPAYKKISKRRQLFKKILNNPNGTGFSFCQYLWEDDLLQYVNGLKTQLVPYLSKRTQQSNAGKKGSPAKTGYIISIDTGELLCSGSYEICSKYIGMAPQNFKRQINKEYKSKKLGFKVLCKGEK